MKAVKLKCEYLTNPIGVDYEKPRLFWNCDGGISQTAYQIIAKDEQGKFLWDTGKIMDASMSAVYSGKNLGSRAKVSWQVLLWDENDTKEDWSEEACFELGLLHASDWASKWISGNYRPVKKNRYPVDCFRKKFIAKNVVKARLYTTACGVYEGRLNGRRIGNFVLAPGITDYRKRIQYQTIDVTALIKDGENVLAFELGDGWYRGCVGAWGLRNQYGTQTKLCAQLEITDSNGSLTSILTDESWDWSDDGPIRQADNKDGEVVDASLSPSYAKKAIVVKYSVLPTASNNVVVTEHETFKPVIITTPGGKTVLDFGQNIAGYLSFSVLAKKGQKIRLRFGEMLDADGEFTQKNIQVTGNPLMGKDAISPLQRIEYLCADGLNKYKPKFCIFGFRYVLWESDLSVHPEDCTAIAVYSDIEQTAFFESSNPLLNQFVKCTYWSAVGNSADLPTDCPTRERHGWTGDAQIFAGTANYLFNYLPFARKYIRDMCDGQTRDGKIPQMVPLGGRDFYMAPLDGSVGWADAVVILPYRLWKQYGDEQILRDNYESMKKHTKFMQRRCGKRQLLSHRLHLKGEVKKYAVNKGQQYGEWAEPADVRPTSWRDIIFSNPEVATAYTCYVCELMTEVAEFLGKSDDVKDYRRYADGTRKAYQALVKTPGYSLDTDRQARLVRPLYFDLLDNEQREFAKTRLLKALDNYGWRVGTGFLSTPLILDVLTEMDIEAAYRLLENEEMPGWLFMPKNGATTVWESWEGIMAQNGIASLNHYSKGAVCEWLFRVMCGVRVAGKNHFIISPKPGGHFSFAKLKYDSVYGTVKSEWERKNGKTTFCIQLPPNTTADIILPDGKTATVNCGTYAFKENIL